MSDLRGIDSQGAARLRVYFDLLQLGRVNPRATIRILRDGASVATVDGDNGLGLIWETKVHLMGGMLSS